ncbi:MAG: DUF3048 domain-containing protein [Peptoniphilus harei]|uniref:Putative lipoprotein n=1 Tax=Peptoniphilus harei ACS-146-V-Sch2b TaxID=908338 RepID=E4KYR6_9FIRM|nr:DUF3048 domain-containing protein [Peptoniphilus harei]EFR32969.1 putative lipoprotein [Peptoniphilus harei ACS-146-V-Sch2b]MDK7755963.1 DUF3048 domain-containing protein [Peptoniphilus harei]MDK7761728.1 DUF3048 domain-containing protein [Peptoniphilus harei]MDK8271387.1 DUF3048 domain-containing protein [Peptoniphilus harei]MDK8339954.1 DUF3048 domain-containing protein [Peptoniphilus harei]
MKKFKQLLLVGLVATTLVACGKTTENKNQAPEVKEPEKIVYYTPLTHEERDNEDQAKKKIFAVMLDNHDDARPQAQISKADIIYEYRVEGEFTRYMALFQSNFPENVGPVRSARPYFVQTAKEYNAIYAHWGGSVAGLEEVKKRNVVDLDGIALEGIVFHRNKNVGKRAPHNGYISLPELEKYLVEKGVDVNDNTASLNFYDKEANIEGLDVGEITLNFNNRYKTNFIYDEATGKYKYIRQGQPVIDEATGQEFDTDNLVVLFQKGVVAGPKGTLKMANIGTGQGLLLQKGKLAPINWEKENEDARTILKYPDGTEVKFYPGRTFFSIVDEEKDAVYQVPETENQAGEGNATENHDPAKVNSQK